MKEPFEPFDPSALIEVQPPLVAAYAVSPRLLIVSEPFDSLARLLFPSHFSFTPLAPRGANMSSRLDHVIQRITAHPRAQHERIIALLESVKLEEDRIEQEHQRVTSSPSPALKLAPETISHILSYLDDRISSVFTGWGRRYGKLSGLAGASLIGRQWAEQARLQRWHVR